MKYQEFIETIKEHITHTLEPHQKVSVQPVVKNNGIVYDGLFIFDPLINVSPTIYLNPYYHRYLNGVSLEDILEDILNTYYQNLPKQDFDITLFTDFSKAKERIVMKLINQKRNEDLLKDIPFIPYMDLAIVFVCSVTDFIQEYATILIHQQHLKLWQIELEELYQLALSNSPKNLPYQLERLDQMIESLANQSFPFLEDLHIQVLTNQLKIHGASCILYPGVLSKIAEEENSNLIIIPSSIHEVLIVPEKYASVHHTMEDFTEMIQEVNDTQLTDDEILGDHAYIYHKDTGTISI